MAISLSCSTGQCTSSRADPSQSEKSPSPVSLVPAPALQRRAFAEAASIGLQPFPSSLSRQ